MIRYKLEVCFIYSPNLWKQRCVHQHTEVLTHLTLAAHWRIVYWYELWIHVINVYHCVCIVYVMQPLALYFVILFLSVAYFFYLI